MLSRCSASRGRYRDDGVAAADGGRLCVLGAVRLSIEDLHVSEILGATCRSLVAQQGLTPDEWDVKGVDPMNDPPRPGALKLDPSRR